MSPRPRESSSRNRLSVAQTGSKTDRRACAGLVAGLVLLAAAHGEARAAEPTGTRDPRESEPVTEPVELRHDLRVDGAVTAGLAASVAATMLLRDEVQPGQCRWCDGSKPSDLNAVDAWFRDALRRPDPDPASMTSHVLAFGLGPVSIGGLLVLSSVVDRRKEGILPDLVIAAQAGISAILLTEVLKPIIVRPRPFAHAMTDEDARREEYAAPESMRSFPSGHTTAVFGAAAASGMVASMRGYRLAPLVWATGIMLGVTTAYARIAADKHYMTDTLGGAAIGLVVGGGVPLLFHPPVANEQSASLRFVRSARFSTTSVPGGRVVSVGWMF